MFIKPCRLRVLLVDIDFAHMQFAHGMKHQSLSDAFATIIVVDKQHFYIIPVHANETDQIAILLESAQSDMGKIGWQSFFIVQDVLFRKKIVRVSHCALPNFDQPWIICRFYFPNHNSF